MEYSLLKNVTRDSHRWRIRVRVTRTNNYVDIGPEKKILRINFVLLDEEGSTMEGQIPQRHVAQFKGNLQDNHVYYIEYFEVTEAKKTYQAVDLPIMARFTRYTQIKEVAPVSEKFPLYAYTLACFNVLRSRIGEKRFLSDTIGVVTAIAHAKAVYPKGIEKTVRSINISDGRETAVVALWGEHAEQFDAAGIHAASINGPVAVLFVGLTVGLYDGNLSLQGSTICHWYTNASIPEISVLQNSFAGMPHQITWIGQTEMNIAPTKTTIAHLSKLNAHKAVVFFGCPPTHSIDYCLIYTTFAQGLTYIVDVAIKSVVPHENWWYMACTACKRTIDQVNGEYICQRCPNMTAETRYKLAVLAADPSESSRDDTPVAEFILFGSMAEILIGAPVLALTMITQNIHDMIPPQITRLYNRQYTFKVSVSRGSLQRINPSFHVDSIVPLATPLLSDTAHDTTAQTSTSSLSTVQLPDLEPSANIGSTVQKNDKAIAASPMKQMCSHSDKPSQDTPTDAEQAKAQNLVPAKRTSSEYTVLPSDSNSPKRPSAMRKLKMDDSTVSKASRDAP